MEVREGYKNTDIGIIPNDWSIVKIKEITDFHKQGYYTKENYKVDGKYYLLRGTDMQNPRIDLTTTPTIDSNEIDYEGYKVLPGDFLFVRSGAIGRYGIVGKDTPKSIFGSYLINFRFNQKLDANYFGYCYESDLISRQLKAITQGGGNLNINAENIKALLIPLPASKSEQIAISTALSDADALITSLEKLIEKKRAIKQGAMQQLLKPKMGWMFNKVKNIASITTGAKNTQDRVDDGLYSFFVRSDKIERINSYSFEGEAILVAGDGVGTGKVINYYKGKFDFHQRVYKISDFQDEILGFYFYLFFKNNFLNRVMQMTAKSSVDSVRMEMISEMIIYYPVIDEQSLIVKILSEMEDEITALEQKLSKYKMIKHGMMQELLTGKTRLV